MRRQITHCPSCDANLEIAELACRACGTTVRGSFEQSRSPFCALPAEQMRFLELFLRCRGNMRDVERTLGLSYPTVRARLDSLLAALGYSGISPADAAEQRREILEALNAGTLTAEDAAAMLEAL